MEKDAWWGQHGLGFSVFRGLVLVGLDDGWWSAQGLEWVRTPTPYFFEWVPSWSTSAKLDQWWEAKHSNQVHNGTVIISAVTTGPELRTAATYPWQYRWEKREPERLSGASIHVHDKVFGRHQNKKLAVPWLGPFQVEASLGSHLHDRWSERQHESVSSEPF